MSPRQQYFHQLVRLAKQRLGTLPRRVADEEDVALSALNSVILGAKAKRFPQLADRTDLWKLLVFVTTRKAIAWQRRHFADKRPDRKMAADRLQSEDSAWMSEVLGREPSPEFAAQFAEQVQNLLQQLPNDDFRQIAQGRRHHYRHAQPGDGSW